ncbi:hypothetical protein PAXRUDRAFT_76217, partial [Paxillus rubicundulus Ve08.2h10]
PEVDIEALAQTAQMPAVQLSMDFIQAIQNAALTDPVAKLDEDTFDWLHNPPSVPPIIENLRLQLSILTYLALEHASQQAY